jgi:hypothetical protein
MTATLEPAAKEKEDTIDFVELYEELEALERRVNMRSRHLQHVKLETCGGTYHPGEQLEEVGVEPTQEEMIEVNLSEEEAEQQLNGETAELESATEWPTNAIGDEDNMKVQIDQIGEEEKENTFQCTQEMEKEEHSMELLKIFNQGDEHKATIELGSTAGGEEHLEEWLNFFIQEAEEEIIVECEPTTREETIDSMDLVDLCEEMEAMERRVKMKKHLIQQVKVEIDGEKRKQIILQGGNQPMDQLDKEIEEIKRLMLEATQEEIIREVWDRGKPAGVVGKKKLQGKGADEQLQEKVWDLGGSQQHGRGSHEQGAHAFPSSGV